MNSDNHWRFYMMGALFGLMGIALVFQTINLQFNPKADDLLILAERYNGAYRELIPPRGQIYDRSGFLLAGNQKVYEVGVELQWVVQPDTIALAVNGVLGLDYTEVLGKASIPFSPDSAVYVPLAYNVPADKVAILEDYLLDQEEAVSNGEPLVRDLSGLVFKPYLKRFYPERDLASIVLGFVNDEPAGYFGVEQYYDHLLAGIPQKVWIPSVPNQVTTLPNIPPGADLILTIDREIQQMVEDILDAAVERYDAQAGTVVIMNPETGEIIAMTSTPRIDLNKFNRYEKLYPDNTPFNRAISKSFEPGSVFKVITMAAALDNGTVDLDTVFFDPGYFKIGGITIKNWDLAAWGEQDMIGCLQHSLNVCLAWIGSEMGAKDFYSYMNAFGFGHYTGVDLANEADGRLKAPGDGDWWPADLGTNTFGQGISITPVQLMQAVSAIANDGNMVVPHVVKAFIENGSQFNISTQIAGSPISAETAHTLTEMLALSLEGEASAALVSGYRLAGKTGTAEIPTPEGYTRAITNASFIGWGPVDDPKFIVYVWLEEPTTSIWGSQTAAPTFAEIVERLVVLLNLPPDDVRLSMEN